MTTFFDPKIDYNGKPDDDVAKQAFSGSSQARARFLSASGYYSGTPWRNLDQHKLTSHEAVAEAVVESGGAFYYRSIPNLVFRTDLPKYTPILSYYTRVSP